MPHTAQPAQPAALRTCNVCANVMRLQSVNAEPRCKVCRTQSFVVSRCVICRIASPVYGLVCLNNECADTYETLNLLHITDRTISACSTRNVIWPKLVKMVTYYMTQNFSLGTLKIKGADHFAWILIHALDAKRMCCSSYTRSAIHYFTEFNMARTEGIELRLSESDIKKGVKNVDNLYHTYIGDRKENIAKKRASQSKSASTARTRTSGGPSDDDSDDMSDSDSDSDGSPAPTRGSRKEGRIAPYVTAATLATVPQLEGPTPHTTNLADYQRGDLVPRNSIGHLVLRPNDEESVAEEMPLGVPTLAGYQRDERSLPPPLPI